MELPAGEVILRLMVAAILGSVVGWERQRKDWAAGLRTHMLVCVGATLIMIVSTWGFKDVLGKPAIVLDPSRIAAQVVSGIGFLGAGTILFLRQQVVKGLTTAAGLWSVAAVGLAIGGGLYVAAVAATLIIFIILGALKPVEQKMFRGRQTKIISMTMDRNLISITDIEDSITKEGLAVTEIRTVPGNAPGLHHLEIVFANRSGKASVLAVLNSLQAAAGITDIRFLN